MSLALTIVSCEKHPDYDQLDNDLVVYTDYDNTKDFNDYKTFYLPDSILEVNGHKSEYWNDENARLLVQQVNEEMQSRGYERITDARRKQEADLGLQLSYVAKTNLIINGGYFNGFWDFGYWGPWWNGWYYPYTISYSYNTNNLMIEMVALQQEDKRTTREQPQKLPVIWYSLSSGYQFSGPYNTRLLTEAIHQSFQQSPYLHTEE